MSRLSIIIPTVNDPELGPTIKSIRDTAADAPEIIVVDDCSVTPVEKTCPDLRLADKVISNRTRLGCGPSRHIGAVSATGDYLLFVDSHSRFEPGWHEKATSYIEGQTQTLWCGICLQPQPQKWPDIAAAQECYHGATLNVCGPDPNQKGTVRAMQVLEGNWLKQRPADGEEIPCVMGACYFIPRDFFLKLSPLRHLRIWSQDEIMLSLTTWLAGGSVRFMPVRVGHKYQNGAEQRQRFTVGRGIPTWNKLFAINCLMPAPLNEILFRKLRAITQGQEWTAALEMVKREAGLFQSEKIRHQASFVRDIKWFADKFNIILPA